MHRGGQPEEQGNDLTDEVEDAANFLDRLPKGCATAKIYGLLH
jgi:hypothetical protein